MSREDPLSFVCQYVDCIEINMTFYRPPAAKTVQSWLDRTAEKGDFFFTAKLHQDITHKGLLEPEMIQSFHEGFGPMLDQNKLRCLLAQFRYDFTDTPDNRAYLRQIRDCFSGTFPLIVEVRHKSWESPPAQAFQRELGVSVCNLDYPTGSQSFAMPCCTIGPIGYLRLHGRNTKKWFSKAGRDETYDYYYKPDELDGIRERIGLLRQYFSCLIVIANNHYKGSALANALELKYRLTGQKQNVPPGLLRAYPQLFAIAAETLFS